jgi:hypothetical protein
MECEQCKEYDRLFELQRKRVLKADKLFQKENKVSYYPDLGKLIDWLLEKAFRKDK